MEISKDFYKILSGIIAVSVNGSIIKIGPFSLDHLYMSEIFADEKYEESLYFGALTQDDCITLLKREGWWTDQDELDIVSMQKNIEQMKLDYFNNFHFESSRDYIKKNIVTQEQRYLELLSNKYTYYQYTADALKSRAKILYLIENSTKELDGSVFCFENIPITKVYDKYSAEILTEKEIRSIAKSNICRNYWTSSKNKSMFENNNYTDMQLSLITWLQVYDNVYESMDCPSEDIIYDDYALDGWFVLSKRKREEERKKNGIESKFSNNKSADMFIPIRNAQEAKDVYNMNSFEGKRKLQMLENDLNTKGVVEHHKTTSIQQDITIAANRLQFNRG